MYFICGADGCGLNLDREKADQIKIMKALIEGLSKTNQDLEAAKSQIELSIQALNRISGAKLFNKWLILASSIGVFLIAGLLFFGWKTQTTNSKQSAKNVVVSIWTS